MIIYIPKPMIHIQMMNSTKIFLNINIMYLILLIILIIILICIYFLPFNIDNTEKFEQISLDSLNVQDGDLILFRWNKVGILHDILSPFTHVGIVINGEILETHLKGDTESYRGGVHLYNLKERIKNYKGYNFILKKRIPLTKFQTNKIMSNLEEYKKIPFHDEYEKHFKNVCVPKKICKSCFKEHIEKQSMFCSEFVGYILKEIGELPKDFNIQCLTPSSFLNLENIYDKEKLFKIKKNEKNRYFILYKNEEIN